ncbi:MAG: DnaJ domain-containing protein [Chromatiales bacterium]|nr:DnaJ domain-containing protein [Chromatiales bacterium]
MQYLFLIAVAALLVFVLVARWLASANPATVAQVMRGLGVLVLAAVVVFVVARGGANLLLLLAPVLLPVVLGLRARNRLKSAAGPSPGSGSDVQTDYLRMHLDHDSGEMSGEVIAGRFKGSRLENLALEELLELWRECSQEDPQSATVLEAYMDRHHGEDWRNRAEGYGSNTGTASGSGPMTEDEALQILGLKPGASRDEIREAHRRLMQKLHPDRGGSDYLAVKINQAKERLIGG